MPTRDTPLETIEVLLRRAAVVERLAERPTAKRELVDELGTSRSTVDRATRELEAAGLIGYSNGGFALTSLGRMAASEFEGVIETIQLRQRLEPFFRWIPDVEFDFDLAELRDAELFVPEPGNPYSMINRHVRLIEETDHFRAVLPLCGLHAYEAVHRGIMQEGGQVESVIAPSVAESLRSNPEFVELTDDLVSTDRFEAHVYEEDIPYFLGLFDGTVQMGVDEDGEPRAILETDSPAVYDWAEQQYRDYEANATQVIP